MFPLSAEQLNEAMKSTGITVDITKATIRQICALAARLEDIAEEKFVHLEMGNPGLPASRIGIEAECDILSKGLPNQYPNISGIPQLKENGSRFLKAFLDIDVPAKGIVPTVGSMQGSFTVQLMLSQYDKRRDTMLFINPGFPVQPAQAKIVGLKRESFDLYEYRGAALEKILEEKLSKGNIAGILYSNPNNPAWTNLTDQELEIIGRMATKYDTIVVEDLAYLGMDFRTDFSRPYEPPYIPTVAKYTDNCIQLLSASKIFSYAGQRIALVCMSEKVASRKSQELLDFYNMPTLLDAFIFGILYAVSSGTAHSAQYAMSAMPGAAVEGKLDFVGESREYGRRANIAKKLFTDNGFHIVYDIDGDKPISDGFFFTIGYKDMDSSHLQSELLRYGIASISLPSTGSHQEGIRVTVSLLSDDDTFRNLEQRLKAFNDEH